MAGTEKRFGYSVGKKTYAQPWRAQERVPPLGAAEDAWKPALHLAAWRAKQGVPHLCRASQMYSLGQQAYPGLFLQTNRRAMNFLNAEKTLRALGLSLVLLSLSTLLPLSASGQGGGVDLDTVRAGRFDMGKMWTFENAPKAYFTDSYGFNADQEWFDRARQAALRIPGCSAAFVSPNGLVVTNHHCVRGSAVVRVTREGESLLDNGFYAPTLEEERPIPNYYVDQLIAAEDVSDEIFAATDLASTDAERQEIRREEGCLLVVLPPH